MSRVKKHVLFMLLYAEDVKLFLLKQTLLGNMLFEKEIRRTIC